MYTQMCSWQYSWKQKVLFFTFKNMQEDPKIIQGKKNDAELKLHDSIDNSGATQEELY